MVYRYSPPLRTPAGTGTAGAGRWSSWPVSTA